MNEQEYAKLAEKQERVFYGEQYETVKALEEEFRALFPEEVCVPSDPGDDGPYGYVI